MTGRHNKCFTQTVRSESAGNRGGTGRRVPMTVSTMVSLIRSHPTSASNEVLHCRNVGSIGAYRLLRWRRVPTPLGYSRNESRQSHDHLCTMSRRDTSFAQFLSGVWRRFFIQWCRYLTVVGLPYVGHRMVRVNDWRVSRLPRARTVGSTVDDDQRAHLHGQPARTHVVPT
jgi:hypothetical protein